VQDGLTPEQDGLTPETAYHSSYLADFIPGYEGQLAKYKPKYGDIWIGTVMGSWVHSLLELVVLDNDCNFTDMNWVESFKEYVSDYEETIQYSVDNDPEKISVKIEEKAQKAKNLVTNGKALLKCMDLSNIETEKSFVFYNEEVGCWFAGTIDLVDNNDPKTVYDYKSSGKKQNTSATVQPEVYCLSQKSDSFYFINLENCKLPQKVNIDKQSAIEKLKATIENCRRLTQPQPTKPPITRKENMSELNLFQKISKIMGEVRHIQKKGFNNYSGYKYATEADIAEIMQEKFVETGLVMYCISCEKLDERSPKTQTIITLKYVFRFQNVDDKEDFIDVEVVAEGGDSGDKACYKAFTGAEKYALMKTFLLPTFDDPERDEKPPKKAINSETKEVVPGIDDKEFEKYTETFPDEKEVASERKDAHKTLDNKISELLSANNIDSDLIERRFKEHPFLTKKRLEVGDKKLKLQFLQKFVNNYKEILDYRNVPWDLLNNDKIELIKEILLKLSKAMNTNLFVAYNGFLAKKVKDIWEFDESDLSEMLLKLKGGE
jgi:hypothetical protein